MFLIRPYLGRSVSDGRASRSEALDDLRDELLKVKKVSKVIIKPLFMHSATAEAYTQTSI